MEPELIYEYTHLKTNTELRLSMIKHPKSYKYFFEYKPNNGNNFIKFKTTTSKIYCPKTIFKFMDKAIKALDNTEIINLTIHG